MSTTPEAARQGLPPAHDPDFAIALAAARRVMGQNPRTTLTQLVAIAWLDGRAQAPSLPSFPPLPQAIAEIEPTLYDNSATCVACGVKERLVQRIAATPEQLNNHICRKCLKGDQP
jgi:hypothetical protein